MPRLSALTVLVVAVAVAGCGGGDGEEKGSSTGSSSGTSTTSAPVAQFPEGGNKTMRALRSMAPEKVVFAPSVSQLRAGENRIGFALFDTARKQVTPDAVAIYVSQSDGRKLRGPFEARRESLRVKPQFMSRQAQADLDDVDTFWAADVSFPKKGRYVLTALASMDGALVSTSQIEMRAGQRGGPPDVGDAGIRVNTDTVDSAAGDVESIDTRIPPLPELHQTDLADVLGKKPVVLAFATPQLCQTRVCGPVVDVVAQVKNEVSDDGIAFIHQEIYRGNDINQGFRPQVGAWRLPTEPWVFLIGSDGKIVDRFEGALSVDELSAAVQKLS